MVEAVVTLPLPATEADTALLSGREPLLAHATTTFDFLPVDGILSELLSAAAFVGGSDSRPLVAHRRRPRRLEIDDCKPASALEAAAVMTGCCCTWPGSGQTQ